MRILQLKTSASRGGAETMLVQLTAGLGDRGHDVTTILGEPGWLQEVMQKRGMRLSVMPLDSPRGIFQVPAIISNIRRLDAEVMFSHGARANLFGSLAASLAGIPSVSVEHNIDHWRESSSFLNVVDRSVARLNRCRIAVSSAVADMLKDQAILPASKIEIIPNGVAFPLDSVPASRESLLGEYGITGDDFLIVVVARLTRQKGHEYLFRALSLLEGGDRQLKCLLLGAGELEAELHVLADELGVTESLIFAGAVDNVLEILPTCDLFVLPSNWEGLPVAVIEAMGMGLPVIATAVSGTPEVVQDGITGKLVPPKDPEALAAAIAELKADAAKREAYAARGREWARREHALDAVLDRYESVLAKVIASGNAKDPDLDYRQFEEPPS